MKDAFGVEHISKTYMGGGVWRSASEMPKWKLRYLPKGRYAQAKGPTEMDTAVKQVVTGHMQKVRMQAERYRPVETAKIKGKPVKIIRHKTTALDKPDVNGEWAPYTSKGGQRQNKGLVVLHSSSGKTTLPHELAHANRRKPVSAYVRLLGNPAKASRDEARAYNVGRKYA